MSSSQPAPARPSPSDELVLAPIDVGPPADLKRRPVVFLQVRDPEVHLEGGSGLRDCILYDDDTVIRRSGIPNRIIEGKLPGRIADLREELTKQLQDQPSAQSLTLRRHQPFLSILLDTGKGWITSRVYGITPDGEPSSKEDSKPVPAPVANALATLRTLEIKEPRAYVARDGQVIMQLASDCETRMPWPKLVPTPQQPIDAAATSFHYRIDLARLPAVAQFTRGLRSNECATHAERAWTLRGREIYPGEDHLDTVRDTIDRAWEAAERGP